MHVFFSGIGGAGIGPLALLAHQAGYDVSGSDQKESSGVEYVRSKGIDNILIGQDDESIRNFHKEKPIDWLVYSSAIPKDNPNHPELVFARENGIKMSKRDEFIATFLQQKNLNMIAIAGTHGKTTTTAMTIWLCKQLDIPVSYLLGGKISFGDAGEYHPESNYFVYEADEYDRNFLSFSPHLSLIAGIAYDHPDIYPTEQAYNNAFRQFIDQSDRTIIWEEDADRVGVTNGNGISVIRKEDYEEVANQLIGSVNRENAALVAQGLSGIEDNVDFTMMSKIMNDFPGVSRRFEKIADNIYTDYAHTPEKIRGAIQTAFEYLNRKNTSNNRDVGSDEVQGSDENRSKTYQAYVERDSESVTPQFAERNSGVANSVGKQIISANRPGVVVVYEGLHNTRQHFIKDKLSTLFEDTKKLYIVPSYLAREDDSLEMLTPEKLCQIAAQPKDREPTSLDENLKKTIQHHAKAGDLVLCLSAGGGGSLDEWLRKKFL